MIAALPIPARLLRTLLGRGPTRLAVLVATALQLTVFDALLVLTGGCLCTSEGTPPMSLAEVALWYSAWFAVLPSDLLVRAFTPTSWEVSAPHFVVVAGVMLVDLVAWAGLVRLVLRIAQFAGWPHAASA